LSVAALPYTLLLLLGQFTAGSAIVLIAVHARGKFEASFIRTCAWLTVAGAALLALTASVVELRASVDSYSLNAEALRLLRAVALAMMLFSLAYAYFVRREEDEFLALASGATTAGLGVVSLILMADLVHNPTWSLAGPLLILFAGAFTLGAATISMVWGHWYLVNPRLPEGPLNEITLVTLAAILAELAVTAVNAVIPVGQKIASDALLAVALPSNPAFWLRIGIGLVFPAVLVFMAYKSSTERAMMSATGLLYIAVGAILAGEALGRGLLFVTGAPV
jgi:hypothetical protein